MSGKLKSAFPDGPPEEKDEEKKDAAAEEKETAEKPHLKESKEIVNLIVVADSDILADSFGCRSRTFSASASLSRPPTTPIS